MKMNTMTKKLFLIASLSLPGCTSDIPQFKAGELVCPRVGGPAGTVITTWPLFNWVNVRFYTKGHGYTIVQFKPGELYVCR